jgi:hypothetical protein
MFIKGRTFQEHDLMMATVAKIGVADHGGLAKSVDRMAKKNHGETWIECEFVNESVSIVEIVRPTIFMIHGYIIDQQGS